MGSSVIVINGENFNFWIVYLVISVVAWIVIGNLKYVLVRGTDGKYDTLERFSSETEGVAILVMAVIFGTLVIDESLLGIAQFIIDVFGAEASNAAAKLCAIAVVIVILIPIYMAIGYTVIELVAAQAFSRCEKRRRTMRNEKKRSVDLIDRWGTDEFRVK